MLQNSEVFGVRLNLNPLSETLLCGHGLLCNATLSFCTVNAKPNPHHRHLIQSRCRVNAYFVGGIDNSRPINRTTSPPALPLALSSTLCLFSFAGTACSADKSGNVNDNFRDPENGTSMTASVSRACSTRSLQ